MPQLELLLIVISLAILNRDAEIQHRRTEDATSITIPDLRVLRRFEFRGAGTYFETVVRQISSTRFEEFEITLFKEVAVSVSHLLQFMNATGSVMPILKFFDGIVVVEVYLPKEAEMYQFV